ncbi:hypothetical protein CBR_g22934 [Chara braunii]|uniref:non-specific serine/threonine protein kinase n=1 Tax=Chara braunii TaxID=69332 RepID=A0A388L332_CHABU|nr:hypothetical protein CBR_g22934 [Chara braunii]|eukprot:GBG76715.1 hypothetical protein CBR_g22934 [Chara braunii]
MSPYDVEGYEYVRDIGSGNFGVTRLMRDRRTKELVAVKYIDRGEKIDENVQREIINHRSLRHPNIVRFREVLLTPTHLAIAMEYAAGGELFERICSAGRFTEDEARFFFQQLISGVSFCHAQEICHRDLKLENTLLDGSDAPRLKICDFGYSKSSLLHSQPKSTVGTPAYIAPEVLSKREYDGKIADVWSCGVTLYVMLVGAYPFSDPDSPWDFGKTIRRIMNVQYSIPEGVHISSECQQLLSRIFVANPARRITIPEIRMHPWFIRNLPADLMDGAHNHDAAYDDQYPVQSEVEIMRILQEARTPGPGVGPYVGDPGMDDDNDMDLADNDVDDDSKKGGGGGKSGCGGGVKEAAGGSGTSSSQSGFAFGGQKYPEKRGRDVGGGGQTQEGDGGSSKGGGNGGQNGGGKGGGKDRMCSKARAVELMNKEEAGEELMQDSSRDGSVGNSKKRVQLRLIDMIGVCGLCDFCDYMVAWCSRQR